MFSVGFFPFCFTLICYLLIYFSLCFPLRVQFLCVSLLCPLSVLSLSIPFSLWGVMQTSWTHTRSVAVWSVAQQRCFFNFVAQQHRIRLSGIFRPPDVCLNPCQPLYPQLRDAFAQYACPVTSCVWGLVPVPLHACARARASEGLTVGVFTLLVPHLRCQCFFNRLRQSFRQYVSDPYLFHTT